MVHNVKVGAQVEARFLESNCLIFQFLNTFVEICEDFACLDPDSSSIPEAGC